MAFDGSVIAGLVNEMQVLVGARISKIAQPERDELLFTLATTSAGSKRLLISAGASLPLLYFTEENKPSPATAPAFCMLLRKHIGGGHILSLSQPSLERIVNIEIEHLNEMGDRCHKTLVIELMGRCSNIIFIDEQSNIIDSIKRVPADVSSLREVLPGRKYYLPGEIVKADPFLESEAGFIRKALESCCPSAKFLYTGYAGLSPLIAYEICHRASIDPDLKLESEPNALALRDAFFNFTSEIKAGNFAPAIYYENGQATEFSVYGLSSFNDCTSRAFDSVSAMLESFYHERESYSRIKQKSGDLRRVTLAAIERCSKKLDLQERQLKDAGKKDKYKKYGELLRAYCYMLSDGSDKAVVADYTEEGKEITIPLDLQLTIQENATRYYDRYQKLRRTEIATSQLLVTTRGELEHLLSIKDSLEKAENMEDLAGIKLELQDSGYIKRPTKGKKEKPTCGKPLHFVSVDGFDIYVGKNNYQNEEVSFKLATANDLWFHIKKRPGSHVIVKCDGAKLSDAGYEQAGRLAAIYSSAAKGEKVEVDYTQRKNLKKPAGGKPGMVIYHTNYSMVVEAEINTSGS